MSKNNLKKQSICPPEQRDYDPQGIRIGRRGARFFCPQDKGYKGPDKPAPKVRTKKYHPQRRIKQIEEAFREAKARGSIYDLPNWKELGQELNELARELGYADYNSYRQKKQKPIRQFQVKDKDALRKFLVVRNNVIKELSSYSKSIRQNMGTAGQDEYTNKLKELNQIMKQNKKQNRHWDDNMNGIMKEMLKIKNVTTTAHCGAHVGRYVETKRGIRLTAYLPYVNLKYSGDPKKFKRVLDNLTSHNIDYRIIGTKEPIFSIIPSKEDSKKLLEYNKEAIGIK
jgi:hypothetical protein